MLDQFIDILKSDKTQWLTYSNFFEKIIVPAKTTLLGEGEISRHIYFIKEGCVRMWFNNDGKDITFQFFFENQPVASIESFLGKKPSLFSMEAIEKTTLIKLKKDDFDILLTHYPLLREVFFEITRQRMENYAMLFLSRIKDNPQKRYKELLENSPHIIQRVPQHYIASYLGITPISLSRIRNKKL
jgi:CRP-like cAMP-binding protein